MKFCIQEQLSFYYNDHHKIIINKFYIIYSGDLVDSIREKKTEMEEWENVQKEFKKEVPDEQKEE